MFKHSYANEKRPAKHFRKDGLEGDVPYREGDSSVYKIRLFLAHVVEALGLRLHVGAGELVVYRDVEVSRILPIRLAC